MAIQSIRASDVARITSGQVITDLVSILKELVENSIDASSTKIEIIFKNNGLESLEVIDNGVGINKEDYAKICLRHHTSKLESFDELETVDTLGFRGEALASLNSIANLSITTCTKNDKSKATQLSFTPMGEIEGKKTIIGGKVGTHVKIKDIFHSLPVRLKNLQKTIKKEYNKTITFLISYLLMYPQIRFSIYNQNSSTGKKNLVMGTQGQKKSTILDSLLAVYGTNGSYGLVPLDIELKDLEAKFKLGSGTFPVMTTLTLKFQGYVSDKSFGLGRSASDRQFVFINRRPVTNKRILKTINEVYKLFNHIQFPVVLLNIVIDPQMLDVNITPDKRVVFIRHEDLVNDVLREELTKFYNSQSIVIPKNQPKPSRDILSTIENGVEEKKPKNNALTNNLSEETLFVLPENHEKQAPSDSSSTDEVNEDSVTENTRAILPTNSITPNQTRSASMSPQAKVMAIHTEKTTEKDSNVTEKSNDIDVILDYQRPSSLLASKNSRSLGSGVQRPNLSKVEKIQHGKSIKRVNEENLETTRTGEKKQKKIHSNSDIYRYSSNLSVSWDNIKSGILKAVKWQETGPKQKDSRILIQNIELQQEQEEKMSYIVFKEDFLKMNIIGQFNLGFILVCKDNNLFIVDQHASDEKYNYEKLMRETQFQSQRLVAPKTLDLNVIDEMTVVDHMELFTKNGFILKYNPDEAPGKRIQLISLPVSRNAVFSEDDLFELIHLINGGTTRKGSHIKCSKVGSILAMRACRSSIMIGQHLTKPTMERVVSNLSTLDKPWNCPHGRPTMRHLIEVEHHRGSMQDYEL